MRRVLLIVAAMAFVACAAVQLNDPDPEGWIALYGGAAAAALLTNEERPRFLSGLPICCMVRLSTVPRTYVRRTQHHHT